MRHSRTRRLRTRHLLTPAAARPPTQHRARRTASRPPGSCLGEPSGLHVQARAQGFRRRLACMRGLGCRLFSMTVRWVAGEDRILGRACVMNFCGCAPVILLYFRRHHLFFTLKGGCAQQAGRTPRSGRTLVSSVSSSSHAAKTTPSCRARTPAQDACPSENNLRAGHVEPGVLTAHGRERGYKGAWNP